MPRKLEIAHLESTGLLGTYLGHAITDEEDDILSLAHSLEVTDEPIGNSLCAV